MTDTRPDTQLDTQLDTLLGRPTLKQLGWNDEFAARLAAMPSIEQPSAEELDPDDRTASGKVVVGRVIAVHRGRWTVASPHGLIGADLLGVFRLGATVDVPAVGDWVRVRARFEEDSKADAALAVAAQQPGRIALVGGTVLDLIPRSSALIRKTIGGTSEGQVIAANVDIVLVAVPLDADINPRRIERQLTAVWDSGARPVLVGTKADQATNGAVDALREAAGDVRIVTTSAVSGEGLNEIGDVAVQGVSLVLLGTSGAGKSSIVNRLVGTDLMATQGMGVAGKGRHTTTHREMLILPSGALLIDTPGMRELGLWMSGGEDGVAATFAEIDEVAEGCRFSDCQHERDADCAVNAALEDGLIEPARVAAWKRLHAEQLQNTRRAEARGRSSGRPRRR
jgi:ribosome biogenesis GTPase / thiamine phosphate phosphatase